jgi:hypothetical protein
MIVPTLTAMPAGYVAQPADMNALSTAATFLLKRPISRVHAGTAQTITSAGGYVAFNTKDYDIDGMWSSGSNARLTVQTPGWYKFRLGITGGSVPFNVAIASITGANNPSGNNVTSAWRWGGWAYTATTNAAANLQGLWPYYLYSGDALAVWAQNASSSITLVAGPNGASTGTTGNGGSFFGLEWISS